MTIEINLLPWRDRVRERRSRRFHIALVLAAAVGLGSGASMTLFYQQRLEAQQQRNAHVEAQAAQLERDIRSIGEYEEARAQMLDQIDVFSRLQVGRPQTVHVFNQLVESLEEGVHYTRLSRQGDSLRLVGLADSNRQVSDQLRALAAASALDVPVLSEVESEDGAARRRFSLSVNQQMPDDVEPRADERVPERDAEEVSS
ncbi:type IV pilus assembly protein PilN [Franzmannia pantelleriensis]|uniref:Type IV pilus assembly protein PilN n=1 Tax=Franzmannia pantelleriensis TaxID=48727 RepID=A0A1G9QBM3_9GAMM|nr:PilN domain-containing protein [Halomonas pantelleriensis]SDM08472.1 type IV pilus assembly protein PilN [Halomonas pantelleriensis]